MAKRINVNLDEFDGGDLSDLLDEAYLSDDEVLYVLKWLAHIIRFLDNSGSSALGNYFRTKRERFAYMASGRHLNDEGLNNA